MPASSPCARRTARASRSSSSIPAASTSTPPAGLPAPLRRLIARSRKSGRTVFANDLSKGTAGAGPPGRRSLPENALIAPIVIADGVAGLVGLLDKPGGFSAADSQLAEVFAEMAAVAMSNSRTVNGLEKNRNALEREVRQGATQLRQAEESFKALVENLPDVVARFDPHLRHLYVSPAVERRDRPPSAGLRGQDEPGSGDVVRADRGVGRGPAEGLRNRPAGTTRVHLPDPGWDAALRLPAGSGTRARAAPYRRC